jgi:hypothetical protein
MSPLDATDRSPEEIQSQIAETRAALDRKVQELERRLSPSARLQQLRSHAGDDRTIAWAAVAAVATGAGLALNGWRKARARNGHDAGELAGTTWVCYTCGHPLNP